MATSRFNPRSHRIIVIGAVATLAAGTFVATNIAGAASGPSAVDYAQCSDGAPGTTAGNGCAGGWINGILNANNSQYREDQATPQRLVVSFPDTGDAASVHVHTVTLKYLDRKANIHAYDSLTSVDATQGDAATTDVRCQGYTGSLLTTCQGLGSPAPHTAAVVDDPTQMGPSATADIVSLHQLPGNLTVFGAKFTSGTGLAGTVDAPPMTVPQHDCTATSTCTTSGDDYATTTISFVTTGGGNNVVQLLFGGHLAVGAQPNGNQAPRGWGANIGSSSVAGGPYHIKWTGADGGSVGNRDNQIMSGAIKNIAQQGSLLSTTPSPTSVVFDSTTVNVSDSATLSNLSSGHNGTGTMEFDLYGPFTAAPGLSSCIDDATLVTYNRISHQTGIAVSSTANTWNSTAVNVASNGPGIYQWVAHYSGDVYNSPEDGNCGSADEQVVVIGGTSTQSIQDTVTVNGAASGAYVNWYLYNDNACATTPVDSDVVGVGDDTNNTLVSGSATSKLMSPSQTAGSHIYYWKVVYHDGTVADTVHGVVEACGVQQVAVQNAPA